ncbi:DUF3772 domain-containing protein [Lutibaculum baratangense]|uniref:Potassium efflux system KefA protein n=1 Tax=Lutibaculum baratangense AMV1 TaxID=631454 RepID=V4RLK4_9HYPH|nr:DUF3772 domain-containing protein [Lutibaculum baratangense]ESR24125.1 Potassium efflux system KefA protein [Lutibaculum baratangense AMV1]
MTRRQPLRLAFLCVLAFVVSVVAALAQPLPDIVTRGGQAQPEATEEAEPRPQPSEPMTGTSLDSVVDPNRANARADEWRARLQVISDRLTGEELGEEGLATLRAEVESIAANARAQEARLEPQLQAVRARLDQLGAAPDDPAEEPRELRERRLAEQGELTRTDAALRNIRLVAVQGEQLALDISATRRARMTERLTAQGPSALSPTLWSEVVQDGARGVEELVDLVVETGGVAWERLAAGPFVALGLSLGMVVFGLRLVRGLKARYGVVDLEGEEASASRKLLRAALITLSIGVLPNLLLVALFVILESYVVLPDRATGLLRGLFVGIGTVVFVFALARALLEPNSPRWRVLRLSDRAAHRMSVYVTAVGCVLGGSIFLQVLNDVLVATVSLDIARRVVTAFLIMFFFIMALRRLAMEWTDGGGAEADRDQGPWAVILLTVLWAVLAVIAAALVLGYVPLASFLAVQLVFAVSMLALLWLALGVTDDLITNFVRPGQRIGHALQAGFGLTSSGVRQVAVLVSGIVRLSLIVFTGMLILLPWGFEADRWTAWLRAAFFGFKVGEVTISISAILTALLLLGGGMVATRAIQNWLGNNYLPNTRLDVGMRNSIRTMSGYVGVIAAAVFAFSYVGLNLENVALLAGALSVGIGFGLQSIVNNFVSGLILLTERPIKEGDWIVVGPEQGYVSKISIRATEIETFDRGTVIVPNSDLITGTVKNWTHSSMIGRVDVSVTVAYDTPTEKVREAILDVTREHASILSYPEPAVLLMDFAERGMTFRLWAFIGDINNVFTVASDLRFEIERRFREEGIVIPLPRRDLTIRGIDRIEAALAGRQARPEATGSASEDGAT